MTPAAQPLGETTGLGRVALCREGTPKVAEATSHQGGAGNREEGEEEGIPAAEHLGDTSRKPSLLSGKPGPKSGMGRVAVPVGPVLGAPRPRHGDGRRGKAESRGAVLYKPAVVARSPGKEGKRCEVATAAQPGGMVAAG